jgi:hypothetical protein
LTILNEMARSTTKLALVIARKILTDKPLDPDERAAIAAAGAADPPTERRPKYSIEDKMRAAEFARRCTGMDKAPATREARTHFGVLRKAEGEAVKVVDE